MPEPAGIDRSIPSLEKQLRAIADAQGATLSEESLRTVARNLADALDALYKAADELNCSRTPPAMRPVL